LVVFLIFFVCRVGVVLLARLCWSIPPFVIAFSPSPPGFFLGFVFVFIVLFSFFFLFFSSWFLLCFMFIVCWVFSFPVCCVPLSVMCVRVLLFWFVLF